MLEYLRTQTTLGALAGMYHQWEKDLRDFLATELQHAFPREEVDKMVWRSPDVGKCFDLLEAFGWQVRTKHWYFDLDACRLVVNVYKHGKGTSLDQLKAKYPRYLKSDLPQFANPDYQDLAVTPQEFAAFGEGIAAFGGISPSGHSCLRPGFSLDPRTVAGNPADGSADIQMIAARLTFKFGRDEPEPMK